MSEKFYKKKISELIENIANHERLELIYRFCSKLAEDEGRMINRTEALRGGGE